MRRSLFTVVTLLALAGAARADEASKSKVPVTPPTTQGSPISPTAQESHILSQVYIGERAPDFELDGSQGRPVRLAHLKGYLVLLVFADRRMGLAPLKDIEPDLRRLGVKPYGICADKAHVLKSYAEREQLPVILLSDVTGEISQLYGLYDTRMRLVRPGFVLIDRQGVVRMALLGQQIAFEEMLALVKSAVTGS
jgi:thioredoxin-dependent peroxiredoxin